MLMTGIVESGRYLQRYSMERFLQTEGYIKQELFGSLFSQGIQLVHGLKANMKNKIMPIWYKIMQRKDISSSALMNC